MELSGGSGATTMTVSTGSYAFAGVANGTYTVTARLAGYTLIPAAGGTTDSITVVVNGASVSAVNFTASQRPSIPTLIQHVASSTNPQPPNPGNNYRFTLPNAVGAGNALILGMSYSQSGTRTILITDDNGNPWPSTPAVASPTGAAFASAIYVLPNANAGVTTITVTFDTAINTFQYTISEFYNVATVSPVNGTSASGSTVSPSLATGTLTPGNNNADGGNLIWSYFLVNGGASFSNQAGLFTPGPGFTLLDADIAWGAQGIPHASEYYVQATAAAVNPSMTVTMDGGNDAFNGVAVALRASLAGTAPPPGIRIVRILHNTTENPGSSWNLQFPSVGNLLVAATANGSNLTDVTSITDTTGNSWSKQEPSSDEPQIWVVADATPNPNLRLSLNVSGTSPTISMLLYDITGAASSPVGNAAGTPSTNDASGAEIAGAPSIIPAEPGLTLAVIGLGTGPSSGLSTGSPPGAIFDFVYYTGETDFDTMDNGDGQAHVFNADTSAQGWNWVVANGNHDTIYAATAVTFSAAK